MKVEIRLIEENRVDISMEFTPEELRVLHYPDNSDRTKTTQSIIDSAGIAIREYFNNGKPETPHMMLCSKDIPERNMVVRQEDGTLGPDNEGKGNVIGIAKRDIKEGELIPWSLEGPDILVRGSVTIDGETFWRLRQISK